ncbi:MAG: rubredoxin [Clostridiales bacterium]|nr:rubredoxin [Clostridiales bacterium]
MFPSKEGRHKKIRCIPGRHIYDSEVGDPDGSIVPGTAFEEISDDWQHPILNLLKNKRRKTNEYVLLSMPRNSKKHRLHH